MINTNGFISEYLRVVKNGLWLEEEEKRIDAVLLEPYAKIKAIEEKYGVKDLENKRKDVLISKKNNKNYKIYFYFRSIVDGIYNLLKEYGWKYSTELFAFLRDNFNIKCCFEDGFDVYYVDTICDFTPMQTFALEYLDGTASYIVCSEYDTCDEIKLPDNLDIEDVLTGVQDFLRELVRLDTQKEKDEEYETYLRLKEKYEGKDNK